MPLAEGASLGMVYIHVLCQEQNNLLGMLCLLMQEDKFAFSRMEPENVSLGMKPSDHSPQGRDIPT